MRGTRTSEGIFIAKSTVGTRCGTGKKIIRAIDARRAAATERGYVNDTVARNRERASLIASRASLIFDTCRTNVPRTERFSSIRFQPTWKRFLSGERRFRRLLYAKRADRMRRNRDASTTIKLIIGKRMAAERTNERRNDPVYNYARIVATERFRFGKKRDRGSIIVPRKRKWKPKSSRYRDGRLFHRKSFKSRAFGRYG